MSHSYLDSTHKVICVFKCSLSYLNAPNPSHKLLESGGAATPEIGKNHSGGHSRHIRISAVVMMTITLVYLSPSEPVRDAVFVIGAVESIIPAAAAGGDLVTCDSEVQAFSLD